MRFKCFRTVAIPLRPALSVLKRHVCHFESRCRRTCAALEQTKRERKIKKARIKTRPGYRNKGGTIKIEIRGEYYGKRNALIQRRDKLSPERLLIEEAKCARGRGGKTDLQRERRNCALPVPSSFFGYLRLLVCSGRG